MSYDKNAKKTGLRRTATLYIVRVAIMAAMLTAVKFALSFIPNVEALTVLIIVYGSTLGIAYALPAALIFCTVEIAIYGAGSWTLLYFVYWPLLAVVASCFLKGRRLWLAVIFGIAGSVLFGVLSACCDTLFCVTSLAPSHLDDYWIAFYLRGLYFDLTHVISSAVTVFVLYLPLIAVLRRCVPMGYGVNVCGMKKYINQQYVREYKRTPSEDGESFTLLD